MVAHSQFVVSVMLMETKPKPSVRKLVEERRECGLCLIPDCGCKANKRGLCDSHYNQYYLCLIRLPMAERIEFEREQIREGRLLKFREHRNIEKPVNPFRK